MENKDYIKIKVKSPYGTTIKKKVDVDITLDDLMYEWKEILLALGYSDEQIKKAINLN